MMHSTPARLAGRRLLTDRRGIAAVEMALVSSFVLLPLMGGLIGIGQAIELQTQLDRALYAGLVTAWANAPSSASNTTTLATTVSTAVSNAFSTTAATAPTTNTSYTWYCIPATGTAASGTASTQAGTCTAPAVHAAYVTITTHITFTPLLNTGITGWNQTGGSGGAVTISASATVRVA